MTTACDEVKSTGSEVIIGANNKKDNPAKATAKVDRVAVKVVHKSATLDLPKEGEADEAFKAVLANAKLEGFVLINGNTQFNLFQTWAEKVTEGGKEVSGTPLMTPVGTLDTHPVSGYYNPISTFGTVGKNEAGDKTVGLIDLTIDTDKFPKSPFSTNAIYTTENRAPFKFTDKGVLTAGINSSTGVIYRIVMNEGENFYTYYNTIYTDLAKLQEHADFNEKDANGEYVTKLDEKKSEELRALNIRVYEKGNVYYTYYIKDRNYKVTVDTDTGTDTFPYYTVMRNSIYSLTINSISKLGSDVPGGDNQGTTEDPDPGVDTDETYLQVTVEVNPWVLNEIPIDF